MNANGFDFQLPVPNGKAYIVLASSDLMNWAPILTNVSPGATVTFTDTASSNYRRRFYRVQIQ
jgi:hypothetical protein